MAVYRNLWWIFMKFCTLIEDCSKNSGMKFEVNPYISVVPLTEQTS